MILDRKTFVIGAVLLGLVGASSWVARKSEIEQSNQPEPHTPDYYLESFTATMLGIDGIPEKRLIAKRMLHYPDDDTTELNEPKMTVYDGNLPPWESRSEKGWVSGDGEEILLQGQVYIDREGSEDSHPIHIITRDLRIHPSRDYAETTEDAFVQSGGSWVESTGMQVWYTQPARVKLLAEVRGRYEPE